MFFYAACRRGHKTQPDSLCYQQGIGPFTGYFPPSRVENNLFTAPYGEVCCLKSNKAPATKQPQMRKQVPRKRDSPQATYRIGTLHRRNGRLRGTSAPARAQRRFLYFATEKMAYWQAAYILVCVRLHSPREHAAHVKQVGAGTVTKICVCLASLLAAARLGSCGFRVAGCNVKAFSSSCRFLLCVYKKSRVATQILPSS